ncbi:DYW domain-containing protein [Plasmodiophora brassicae]
MRLAAAWRPSRRNCTLAACRTRVNTLTSALGAPRRCSHAAQHDAPVRRGAPRPSPPTAAFFQHPSVPLAIQVLRHPGTDPRQAWAVFERVVDGRSPVAVPFFMRMLQFCQRALPSKAAEVMRAAIAQRVPVDEALFCTFLAACKRAVPALDRDALDLYQRAGPITHNVLCSLAGVCRAAHNPESALPLVSDAAEHGVQISDVLLSVFAACCAEAHSALGAATAARILGLIRSNRIAPYRNHQLYANLAKAFLSQKRFDDAVAMIPFLDSIGMPPTQHLFGMVIGALVNDGAVAPAMSVFHSMRARCVSLLPEVFTSLVTSCGNGGHLDPLQTLYAYAVDADQAVLQDAYIVSAFIVAFSRCGRVDIAQVVFRRVPGPSAAVSSAMVSALTSAERIDDALDVFQAMVERGTAPPGRTFAGLVTGCARHSTLGPLQALYQHATRSNPALLDDTFILSAFVYAFGCWSDLATVRSLHEYAAGRPITIDEAVVSAFVSAYARCGQLHEADRLLLRSAPGLSGYNAMIAAYGRCGMLSDAVATFARLKQSGLKPDARTLTSLLSACAHAADSQRAQALMSEFESQWKVQLDGWHRNCLIDLRCRLGDLDLAEQMARTSPTKNIVAWLPILSACLTLGDLGRAERCFAALLLLPVSRPHLLTAYDIMADIYAAAGRQADVDRLRADLHARGLSSVPSRTSLVLASRTVQFRCGDDDDDDGGDVPSLLAQDLSSRGTDAAALFRCHSELRAVSYGLEAVPPGDPIYATKTTRVSAQCHDAIGRASALYRREISIQEATRYHRFRNGQCSCQGYR